MEFTKEMAERLHGLFTKKSELLFVQDWDSWLESMGVGRISREKVIGDADRFKGMVIINNPGSWTRRPDYLLVPKDVAEKLLVLGVS